MTVDGFLRLSLSLPPASVSSPSISASEPASRRFDCFSNPDKVFSRSLLPSRIIILSQSSSVLPALPTHPLSIYLFLLDLCVCVSLPGLSISVLSVVVFVPLCLRSLREAAVVKSHECDGSDGEFPSLCGACNDCVERLSCYQVDGYSRHGHSCSTWL